MTRRRGQNEGSIFKRVDGRWEGRLNLGWRNGKRRSKSFYGDTREEVARLLADAKSQHDKGIPVPMGRETVGTFFDAWLASVRPTVRPRTWESYELYLRRHAKPIIGSKRLSALRPADLRELLRTKLAELSPQSVVHLRTILNTALRQAVADRLLAWNPLSSVKRPKVKRRSFRQLNPEQARAFLTAADTSRLGAMFAIGLALGLRRGEALGLRWCDIDIDAKTVRVEQTIQRVRTKIAGTSGFVVADPKTDRSRRTLVIPAMLMPVLRRHRARQAEERLAAGANWNDSMGLVFTSPSGRPIEPRTVQQEFKATLRRADLPDMRLHDLRHCAASFLIAQGVPLRAVMELLGHSTITLTANTYGHIQREMLADMADRMDAVLSGKGSTS